MEKLNIFCAQLFCRKWWFVMLCQSNSGQKTWNFSWYQEHFVENCEMKEFQEIIVFLQSNWLILNWSFRLLKFRFRACKLAYKILQHLYYMRLHFEKARTHSSWELMTEWWILIFWKHMWWTCIWFVLVLNGFFINLNGTKWRSRFFEQNKRFISWFILQHFACDVKVISTSNLSSNEFKTSETIRNYLATTQPNKSPEKQKPIHQYAHLEQNFYHSEKITIFWNRQIFSELSLKTFDFSGFGEQELFLSRHRVVTIFETDK